MKIIGITGGVGAGKTAILSFIEKNYNAKVMRADEVSHMLMQPGTVCYMRLLALLGEDVLSDDGGIDHGRMAATIFHNKGMLQSVDQIIHPAVKEYLLDDMEHERKRGYYSFYFLEAALLIEDGYQKICDELWYIYADRERRSERLKAERGYDDKRIAAIMASQADDQVFRRHCARVIDNSGSLEDSFSQVREHIERISS